MVMNSRTNATIRIPIQRHKSPRDDDKVVVYAKLAAPSNAPNDDGSRGILVPITDPMNAMATTVGII